MNKGGTLIIPKGIEPIRVKDGEIARQYIVLADSYLCANSPPIVTHSILNDQRSEVEIKYFGSEEEKVPALLVEKKQNVMLGVTGQVKASEVVLARDVPDDSSVMQVATFKKTGKSHDNMTETGDGIVIKNKGYVLKSQLKPDHSKEESFKRPLLNQFLSIFPHDNLIEDVHQYSFGNCFLLASVLAILNQEGGSDYIKSLMVQKQGSTVVKLFDPDQRTFVYYEISNTYHQKSGQTNVRHKAPWVHILEKAYTVHAYKKNNQTEHDERKFVATFPSFAEAFGSGGNPDVALTILTGFVARERLMKSSTSIPWGYENLNHSVNFYNNVADFINKFEKEEIYQIDQLISEISQAAGAIDFLLSLKSDGLHFDENICFSEQTRSRLLKLSRLVFPKTVSCESEEKKESFMYSFSEYVRACRASSQTWDHSVVSMFGSLWNVSQMGKYCVEELKPQNKFDKFIESVIPSPDVSQFTNAVSTFSRVQRLQPRPPEELINAFTQYLSPVGCAQRWDGELGTGIYSDDSLEVFAEISDHLNSSLHCNAVVASTQFKSCADTLGLRPQHAYAVVGTKEKTVGGKSLKFITVRNPWSHTGRMYHWDRNEGIAVENKSAEAATFDVELSDFTRYFYKFTIGEYKSDQSHEIKENNNMINLLVSMESVMMGLVIGGIGVAFACAVSLIFLPIIVGLGLLMGACMLSAILICGLDKPAIPQVESMPDSVRVNTSSSFYKSSTVQMIKKFEAEEEFLSRNSNPAAAYEGQRAVQEKKTSSKSRVDAQMVSLDEFDRSLNAPCR